MLGSSVLEEKGNWANVDLDNKGQVRTLSLLNCCGSNDFVACWFNNDASFHVSDEAVESNTDQ